MKTQDSLNAKQTSQREPRRGTARAQASKTKARGSRNAGRACTDFPVVEIGNAKIPQASGRRPGEAADEISSRPDPADAEIIMKQRSSTASWLELKQLIEPPEIKHGELTSTRPSKAMNKKTDPTYSYVSIDVSKATLQVQDDGRSMSVSNGPEGFRKIMKHLKTCTNPLVVFEASGGYERALTEFLHEAAIPLAMVNPARVRYFARSEGVRAKTDPIDGRMILAFAKSKALRPMQAPPEACVNLAALLDRRDHLVEQLTREKNRLQNSEALIHRSIKRMIRILEKEIENLEQDIKKLASSNAGLKSRTEIIQSVSGVGKITAWTLMAYLSEMEKLNRNRLVALAGVAPYNSDSGNISGKRSIQGGRAKVRKCLYMAAHTAARCNTVIAPYVRGLIARGKPYKCAIVAAMRKLLIYIQSLLKKTQLSPC